MPSVGRTRWTRPINGPSRSRLTGAAPATARSSTGPTASRARVRTATSSTTSSTSRRRYWKRRDCPQPIFGRRRPADADRRRQHALLVQRRQGAERHETQYFEMFGNRGIYHKGWTAVTRHKTPWLLRRDVMPAFDDDVWELYDTTKTGARRTTCRRKIPEKLHELQRLWLIEAVKYNVLPLDDEVAERDGFRHRAGRPVLIKGNSAGAVRRHGPARRELRPQHQEQVALGDGRDRGPDDGPEWRDHRAGREHRRLETLRQGRQAQVLLQPAAASNTSMSSPTRRSRPASTRCGWSSPMTAAAWQGRRCGAVHRW